MAEVAAALVPSLFGAAKKARDKVRADRDLQERLDNALRDTDSELRLLREYMKNKEMSESNEGHGDPQRILELHELVYSLEDFKADRRRDRKTSAPARLLKAAFQWDPRSDHLERFRGFTEKIEKIIQADIASHHQNNLQLGGTTAGDSRHLGSAPQCDDPPPVGMEKPKKEIMELLLAAAGGHEDERKVISIVGCAGVGKTALAKALWYDHRVQARFSRHRCAWVQAPQSSDEVHILLQSLLQHFHTQGNQRRKNRQHCHSAQEAANTAGDDGRLQRLQRTLRQFLCNKRYLVIVDGVQQSELLDTILSALPENKEGSRVVVTTSISSVAKGFSPGGYLYTMRGLDSKEAMLLFRRTLELKDQELLPSAAVEDLETLFNKCGGLPLVVVGAANYLRAHHRADLKAEHCEKVATGLGNHEAFEEARTALARYWHSLPRYEQKMCMFSLSSFPNPKDDDDGHGGIKTKSLLRRWVAEGLVARDVGKSVDEVACDNWDKLLDLGVLEPVSSSSSMRRNSNRCQVHGVTLECLVHRSVTWNFIALVQEGHLLHRGDDASASSCNIRRVAIHGGSEDDIERALEGEGRDLSSVRSLTVRKTSSVPASLLRKCRMLRVLDLEGCTQLGSESDDDHHHHVRLICELLHLRYLSLRSTGVAEIPRSIRHLQSLETLDVRDTKVDKLPMEALKLPQLAHLFGRFELPAELEVDHLPKKKAKLQDFFSKKSKLVTLAGFKIIVNSKRRGHELILRHARALRKVKIWCVPPPAPADDDATVPPPPKGGVFSASFRRISLSIKVDAVSSPPDDGTGGTPSILDGLVTSLESRFTGTNALDSLSVDFPGGHCKHFLGCALKETCAVSSIKVRGQVDCLPGSQELMKLRHIKELHLCNTGLVTTRLSELQSMHYLVYLKLTEDDDQSFRGGSFHVGAAGFPSLQRLCFHGQWLPALVFTPGSMKSLLSLQLICRLGPQGSDLGVTGVENLPRLDEVILHPEATEHSMKAWREETLKNSRRPSVKKQQRSNHTVT